MDCLPVEDFEMGNYSLFIDIYQGDMSRESALQPHHIWFYVSRGNTIEPREALRLSQLLFLAVLFVMVGL